MTRPRRVWGGGAAVALAGALALSACGIPVDSRPTALSRQGVPFGLLQPTGPSSTVAPVQPSPVDVPVQIFLFGTNGHLVAVDRDLPVTASDLAAVVGALVVGPTDAEARAGIQSALPALTTVLPGTAIAGGVATVNLGGTFGQLVGTQEIEAVAQVVFTASALPGVTGVTFELSGSPVAVPVASGADVPVATTAPFAPTAPAAPA
jgi:hypothetical protein